MTSQYNGKTHGFVFYHTQNLSKKWVREINTCLLKPSQTLISLLALKERINIKLK